MELVSDAAVVVTYLCRQLTTMPEGTQRQCGVVMIVPIRRSEGEPGAELQGE